MASCINSSFLSFEIPDPDSEFKHHLFPHFYGAEDAAKPSLSNHKRTKLLLTVSFLSAFQTPDPGLTFKHPLFPHFYGAEYGAKLSLSKHIRTWLFLTVSFLSTPQTPDSDTAFNHHLFPSFYGAIYSQIIIYHNTKELSCCLLRPVSTRPSYQLFKPQTQTQRSNIIFFPHFYGAEYRVRRAGQHKGGELCDW